MKDTETDKLVGAYVQNEKGQFVCDWKGCGRSFASPVGVRMHRIRAHTNPWSTTRNLQGKGDSKQTQKAKDRAARQRKYNAAMRARYVARGLTSAGKPRSPRYNSGTPRSETPKYRREKYLEQVARYHAKGLNAHGQPFKNNNISKGMRRSIAKGVRMGPQPKRLPYVYPVPQAQPTEQPALEIPATTLPPEWIHAQLHFCPHCGEKLTAWKKQDA